MYGIQNRETIFISSHTHIYYLHIYITETALTYALYIQKYKMWFRCLSTMIEDMNLVCTKTLCTLYIYITDLFLYIHLIYTWYRLCFLYYEKKFIQNKLRNLIAFRACDSSSLFEFRNYMKTVVYFLEMIEFNIATVMEMISYEIVTQRKFALKKYETKRIQNRRPLGSWQRVFGRLRSLAELH